MGFPNLMLPTDSRFVVHWMKTPDRGYIHLTQICLIRHGQTDWNKAGRLQGQTDIPLNEAGRKQARECRDHLSGGDWDVMITTSLNRARETGEIINEKMNLPIEIMDEFMERGFGEGEGLTREERRGESPMKGLTSRGWNQRRTSMTGSCQDYPPSCSPTPVRESYWSPTVASLQPS